MVGFFGWVCGVPLLGAMMAPIAGCHSGRVVVNDMLYLHG